MNRRMRLCALLVGALLAGVVGWLFGSGGMSGEYDGLIERRGTFVEAMKAVRVQREARPGFDDREQAIVARTLGPSIESVDSRIRQRLYALGSTAGLSDLSVVTSGSASARRETPAKRAFERRGTQKTLRDETDFIEVEASMAGEGSIDQVLRLLGWIDADPWIKRITQFRLNPNADGTRIKVNLKLTTLFLPGRTPEDPPAPGELDLARINGLVALNPFRIPPPPAPPEVKPEPSKEPAPVAAPKPPPVGFPYENWVLTGVAVGPDGPEAWLRNVQNKKRRTMRPGGSIGDAVLVDIEGEIARFTLGDATFKVRIGRSLATGRDTNL